jgi:hypothetical protein
MVEQVLVQVCLLLLNPDQFKERLVRVTEADKGDGFTLKPVYQMGK